MIKLKWSEQSLTQMMVNLQQLKLNSKQGAKRALREVAVNIMAQSRAEIPVDTGTARNSSYITNPVDWGKRITIIMGYGGPNDKRNPDSGKMASEYVLELHETPGTPLGGGAYHPYGKWKFLEDPVRAHAQAFIQTLGKELRIAYAPGVRVR